MVKDILIAIQLMISAIYSLVIPDGITGFADTTALDKYNQNEFRILIVPGHDNDTSSGGAEFGGLREADLNVDMSEELLKLFQADTHFRTQITRNKNNYLEPFLSFFTNNRENILQFRAAAKANMEAQIAAGKIIRIVTDRPDTSEENAIKLYGINKWAADNNIDLILHPHFNDYPGRYSDVVGKYSGLAMYIPEHQMPNFTISRGIAQPLLERFKKFFPISNHPKEKAGLVEDQELIAIGANTNLRSNISSIIIEYGYLYEPQWMNPETRETILKELAYQTYAGVKKYFGETGESLPGGKNPTPYVWRNELAVGLKNNKDVLALQIALTKDGLYPPPFLYRNDCPLSGSFGRCTYRSLKNFQGKFGLPQSGQVDGPTLKKLNEIYKFRLGELAD